MPDISIVLCTYNRADCLPAALNALASQAESVSYEVVVVDNNSTDATRAVVRSAQAQCGGKDRIRYVFEARQGLSHARNRGIESARSPIVAFTDDDVRVAPDWVGHMARTFEEHPDIDYVSGPVVPRWLASPPGWLTTAHWSPLALQDYGPEPIVSSRARAICFVGANLAFRRRVFDRVGTFAPELGRVKDGIGSTEDHDMQLRVWRAGMAGLYTPSMVAWADVAPDRLTKAYHRRWHRGHGRHCAAMRLRELVPEDMGPMSEPADIVRLFGSPGFVYADLVYFAWRWLRALVLKEDSFFYANKLRHIWSYVRAGRPADGRGAIIEIAAFWRAYRRKRRSQKSEVRSQKSSIPFAD